MTYNKEKRKIAIIGGGPSALFIYKRLVEAKTEFEIDIFERKASLGAGMPYSDQGANIEHVTNVSDNEIPEIANSIQDWIKTVPKTTLNKFSIDPQAFNGYHVLPRLLFGQYLAAQFELLRNQAEKLGITTRVHFKSNVTDIIDWPELGTVQIEVEGQGFMEFDSVIICSGHNWPLEHEGKIQDYFDSPYPPSKFQTPINHPIAIKGSSLTAIDAIRTLARRNGSFYKTDDGKLAFKPSEESPKFKIVMHSRNGLLPTIRFHLDEPQLSSDSLLTREEIAQNKAENGGFLSLDFIFEKNFKEGFRRKDPKLYKKIKDMTIEKFVELVMDMREGKEPFQLFREEYTEAEKSMKEKKSVYWKEMLAELSFTMNYPAKYLSAEDMMRLKKVLMPLISIVIAFVPQSSCEELFALNDSGRLEIVPVGPDSTVVPRKEGGIVYKYTDDGGKKHAISYKTFINCVGQPHLSYDDLPFKSLLVKKTVSQGMIRFKDNSVGAQELKEGNELVVQNANGDYFLKVSGITISDDFRVVNEYGIDNERIYIMAVPYIGGYNPDYSGLDFCEEASNCIVGKLRENL